MKPDLEAAKAVDQTQLAAYLDKWLMQPIRKAKVRAARKRIPKVERLALTLMLKGAEAGDWERLEYVLNLLIGPPAFAAEGRCPRA